MANQRTTFAKRQREQNRKDKARAKQERLAVRRAGRDVPVGDTSSGASVASATTTSDVPARDRPGQS